MMYNSYNEIITDILKKANDEEKRIISEEDQLFKNRKWENYVLALVNFFNDIHVENFGSGISFGGSVTDSYIIREASRCKSKMIGKPCRQRSREILFNDALRIICEVHLDFLEESEISVLYNKLIEFVKHYGLSYKHAVMPNNFHGLFGIHSKTAEVFIISNENNISDDYVNVVKSEKQVKETEESNNILRGRLRVDFATISGL